MRVRKLSTLELAMLGMLSKQSLSGYVLRGAFSLTPLAHYSDSPGSIYPALKRLERKKLIQGTSVMGKTRRPSITFQLTKRGRTSLVQWLRQPVTLEEVKWDLAALHLKLAFMENHLSRGEIVAMLKEMDKAVEKYLKELRRYLVSPQGGELNMGQLVMHNGVMGYETQQRWVRWALKRLQGASKK